MESSLENSSETAFLRTSGLEKSTSHFRIGAANSKNPSTVYVRGYEHLISDVLGSNFRLFRNVSNRTSADERNSIMIVSLTKDWHWKSTESLFWDDSAGGRVLTVGSCLCLGKRVFTALSPVLFIQRKNNGQAAGKVHTPQ